MSERELAGYVAPIIRSTEERVLRRRVKTYDRETGEVTGEVTMREVVGGLAQATALGLEVVEGVRPKETACTLCGKPVPVPSTGGAVERICRGEDGGCHRQKTCASEGCARRPPNSAFTKAKVRRRSGAAWRCVVCASSARLRRMIGSMTPEQRSEKARGAGFAASAAMTPEQRSERARRVHAAMTPEQRSERARKANAARKDRQ